jgi:hypothetical protein
MASSVTTSAARESATAAGGTRHIWWARCGEAQPGVGDSHRAALEAADGDAARFSSAVPGGGVRAREHRFRAEEVDGRGDDPAKVRALRRGAGLPAAQLQGRDTAGAAPDALPK